MAQPISGGYVLSSIIQVNRIHGELRVPIGKGLKTDQDNFLDIGCGEKISFSFPLPGVVEDLQRVNLSLKFLGQLVIKPLSLHVVAHCYREYYRRE